MQTPQTTQTLHDEPNPSPKKQRGLLRPLLHSKFSNVRRTSRREAEQKVWRSLRTAAHTRLGGRFFILLAEGAEVAFDFCGFFG
jgi:hypothetical protein